MQGIIKARNYKKYFHKGERWSVGTKHLFWKSLSTLKMGVRRGWWKEMTPRKISKIFLHHCVGYRIASSGDVYRSFSQAAGLPGNSFAELQKAMRLTAQLRALESESLQ